MRIKDLAGAADLREAVTSSGGEATYVGIGTQLVRAAPQLEVVATTDFAIKQIAANASNTFIAVAGDGEIVIFTAGGDEEATLAQKDVLKLLWHPLAAQDGCLVVLVPGAVYLHTMSTSGLSSERIDLSGGRSVDPNSSTYSVEVTDSPRDAVTMTFGGDGNETGQMTLYLSTEDGDIYALAPVLPPKFVISPENVELLLSFAVSAEYHLESTSLSSPQAHSDPRTGKTLRKQRVWAHDVQKQLASAPVVWTPNGQKRLLERPDRGSLAIQGPYAIEPAVDFLFEQQAYDLDMTVIDGLPLLVQGLSRSVAIYLVSEPVNLMWADAALDDTPVLPLAQLVKTDHENLHVQAHACIVFTSSADRTTAISLDKWARAVLKPESAQSGPNTDTVVKTGLPRSVVRAFKSHILSWPISEDPSVAELWRFAPNAEKAAALQITEGNSLRIEDAVRGTDEIFSLLDSINVRPSVSAPAGLIKDDVSSVQAMSEIADVYEVELAKLHKAISGCVRLLKVQDREYERQKSKVAEVSTKISKMLADPPSSEARSKRAQAALDRMERIESRVTTLNQRLDDASQGRALSRQETEWMAEVRRLEKRINGTASAPGLEERVDNLKGVRGTAQRPPAKRTVELMLLKQQLDAQDKQIRELRTQLQLGLMR